MVKIVLEIATDKEIGGLLPFVKTTVTTNEATREERAVAIVLCKAQEEAINVLAQLLNISGMPVSLESRDISGDRPSASPSSN